MLYERVRVRGALLALDWALRPACPGARTAGASLFLVPRAVHHHGPERRAGWQERPTLPSCSRGAESLQRDLGAEKFSDLLPPVGSPPPSTGNRPEWEPRVHAVYILNTASDPRGCRRKDGADSDLNGTDSCSLCETW